MILNKNLSTFLDFFLPKQFSLEVTYYSTHGIVGDCKYYESNMKITCHFKRYNTQIPMKDESP